jgi:hypothetical protein
MNKNEVNKQLKIIRIGKLRDVRIPVNTAALAFTRNSMEEKKCVQKFDGEPL